MRIAIDHRTTYRYSEPVAYGVQELRLEPQSSQCQKIVEWQVDVPGAAAAARYVDANGNSVMLVNQTKPRDELTIVVKGIAETVPNHGVIGELANEPRASIYIKETPLTEPGRRIARIASAFEAANVDDVSSYHQVMDAIRQSMNFDAGQTHATTTGEEALTAGHGVCQDFSHVFIAVCRLLGRPARYVTGYLVMDETGEVADAHHAWAEVELPGLGWVGFDPANGISPDERYVRLACGHDADYAAPVRGIRRGSGTENLSVQVSAGADGSQ